MVFHHGTEFLDPIFTARPQFDTGITTGVLLGTAGKGPNTPTLVTSKSHLFNTFGLLSDDEFSIPKDGDDYFNQGNSQLVVINVLPSTTVAAESSESTTFGTNDQASLDYGYVSSLVLGTAISGVLTFAADDTITLPAGITSVDAVKSEDGTVTYVEDTDYSVAANVITRIDAQAIAAGQKVTVEYTATLVAGTDYTLDAENGVLTRLLSGKIIRKATITATSYNRVDASGITATDIVGTVGSPNTGAKAIADIKETLKVNPLLYIAPDWTYARNQGGGYNIVVNELLTHADVNGAIVVTNTPNTTKEDAVTYAQENLSKRLYACKSWQRKTIDGTVLVRPTAAAIAGLIAGVDARTANVGTSPSNQLFVGIEAIDKPDSHQVAISGGAGANTDTNFLNINGVATILNFDGGFRLFGNKSTTDENTQEKFLKVQRVVDLVTRRELPKALTWAIDNNITTDYELEVSNFMKRRLENLEGRGILLTGFSNAYAASADINTPEAKLNGEIYFDIEFAVSSPAEQIKVRTRVVNGYVASVTTEV